MAGTASHFKAMIKTHFLRYIREHILGRFQNETINVNCIARHNWLEQCYAYTTHRCGYL